MPVNSQGQFVNDQGQTLGDLLGMGTSGTIVDPATVEPPPDLFDALSGLGDPLELGGAIAESIPGALDPLNLRSLLSGDTTGQTAAQQAAGTIASGISAGLKWSLILATGYFLLRSEINRR